MPGPDGAVIIVVDGGDGRWYDVTTAPVLTSNVFAFAFSGKRRSTDARASVSHVKKLTEGGSYFNIFSISAYYSTQI